MQMSDSQELDFALLILFRKDLQRLIVSIFSVRIYANFCSQSGKKNALYRQPAFSSL